MLADDVTSVLSSFTVIVSLSKLSARMEDLSTDMVSDGVVEDRAEGSCAGCSASFLHDITHQIQKYKLAAIRVLTSFDFMLSFLSLIKLGK